MYLVWSHGRKTILDQAPERRCGALGEASEKVWTRTEAVCRTIGNISSDLRTICRRQQSYAPAACCHDCRALFGRITTPSCGNRSATFQARSVTSNPKAPHGPMLRFQEALS